MLGSVPGWPFNTNGLPFNIVGRYSIEKEIDTNVLSNIDARKDLILGMMKEILNSFNYSGYDEAKLIELINSASRTHQ